MTTFFVTAAIYMIAIVLIPPLAAPPFDYRLQFGMIAYGVIGGIVWAVEAMVRMDKEDAEHRRALHRELKVKDDY